MEEMRMKPRKKSSFQIENLPIDVIINIISKLPIKPLLRCKIVCKSWLSLITTTTTTAHFADLHLRHSLSSNSGRLLVVADSKGNLSTVDLDSRHLCAAKLRLPTFLKRSGIRILGSCNGILLLLSPSKFTIVLLNPSTRQYRVIPSGPGRGSSYGFGFDHVNSDYKVFVSYDYGKTTNSDQSPVGKDIMVFSLKMGSWKFVENGVFPEGYVHYYSKEISGGVLIGTHLLHWVLSSSSPESHSSVIGCFDLCDEKWSLLPLPDDVASDNNDVIELSVLQGCLCLVTVDRHRYCGANVWIMKEYGVAESWVKLLGSHDVSVTQYLTSCPIAYSSCGREILFRKSSQTELLWYDLGKKMIRAAEVSGIADYCEISVCWGSLATFSDSMPI